MNVKAKSTKLLSALLSLLLILTLSPFATATAWGEDLLPAQGGTGVITDASGNILTPDTGQEDQDINDTTSSAMHTLYVNSDSSRTYNVYQIFTGDYSKKGTNGALTNIKWGENAKNGTDSDGNAVEVTIGSSVSGNVISELEGVNTEEMTDSEQIEVISKYANIASTAIGAITSEQPFTGVTGYYLITETTETTNLGDGAALSQFVVMLLGSDVIITPKDGGVRIVTPEINVKPNGADSSKYDKSAVINRAFLSGIDLNTQFDVQLQATISDAENGYDEYASFPVTLTNTLGAGLYLPNTSNVKVYIDGNEITSGFELTLNNNTLTVDFADLKTIASVKAGSVINVEYTGFIYNRSIVLNGSSNATNLQISYKNDPPDLLKNSVTTVKKSAYIYSYQLKITSYNEDSSATLTGASFDLYKVNTDGSESKVNESPLTVAANGVVKYSALEEGSYKLIETTAPNGYNPVADIEFTVEINESEGVATIAATSENASFTSESGNGGYTGVVSIAIQHSQGANLPMPLSGGLGTSLFYLIGAGCLVAGCMALVVYRRRRLS